MDDRLIIFLFKDRLLSFTSVLPAEMCQKSTLQGNVGVSEGKAANKMLTSFNTAKVCVNTTKRPVQLCENS